MAIFIRVIKLHPSPLQRRGSVIRIKKMFRRNKKNHEPV